MAWEVFKGRGQRKSHRVPGLTIQARGIFLNRAAFAALGSPDSVELGFDFKRRIIRISAGGDCHLRAANGMYRIAAGEFCDWANLDRRQARHYPAKAGQEGMLVDLAAGRNAGEPGA